MKTCVSFVHIRYPYGGGEKVTTDLSDYFINRGYSVYLFVGTLEQGKMGIVNPALTIVELPNRDINTPENRDFIIDRINALEIRFFILPGHKYDYLPQIKTLTRCRIIYLLHNKPLWEIPFKMEAGYGAARVSFLKAMEWFLFRKWKYTYGKSFRKKILDEYRKYYEQSDAYIVLCESYRDEIVKLLNAPLYCPKVEAITNPVQPDLIDLKSEKKKEVLYMGRLLYPQKRVDRLIRIWAKIEAKNPDWKLKIVGDGPEKSRLKKKVKTLGLHRVEFHAFSASVKDHYQGASILCLTSTYEGWPLVLVEAQASGVVPISFDCCSGVREILFPERENGMLVEPFRLDEYASKLSLLMQDEGLRNRIAKNNIVRVRQFYTTDQIGEKWISLFDRLQKRG
jgi:glycosyltransferase involved in cell wall biosynthesis